MNVDRVATTDIGTDARNRITEAREIEGLQTGPDRAFLYVHLHRYANGAIATSQNGPIGERSYIQTWLGTVISSRVYFGPSVPVGGIAGRYAHKRSVDCTIFGVRYTGWYYESAGDYCRLRKAKRQPSAYHVGDRIRIHPASDWFMRGATYATVTRVTPGKALRVELENITPRKCVWLPVGDVLEKV